MTIERQTDFLGKIVRRVVAVSGYEEIIENLTPFVQGTPSKTKFIQLKVLGFDTLEYHQGQYTGLGRRVSGGLWELEERGTTIKLTKGRINQADIRGKRNKLGLRVSYRWKPSPDDLDLFIEAATGHRPIFSE